MRTQLFSSGTGQELTDRSSASAKARDLLCEILPLEARAEFLATDGFRFRGKRAMYRISRSAQTEIYLKDRLTARACLQLTVPAPSYDRMIAEYLILNSDENLYWTKANVFPAKIRTFGLPEFLLVGFNLALLIKLVLDYLM